jgi:hypothetical protein
LIAGFDKSGRSQALKAMIAASTKDKSTHESDVIGHIRSLARNFHFFELH